ncbi:MAG TPA: bifunctional methylenetetrahydrofolate dehydrogenase/methenyltetrahydrofolate cyclohydrolase FolD [Trichococcus sp.]|jgi:methylenetetrahydrofolate dehydrogenase (NADP+)/methenyltetrahydrofolate cyclohydrolase|uniref:bifunctional methylenetetrahydrofolate dehydrogenase/methenyltetrahydrofolate cyclohydrolase FolD n=1 Tax=Trichococcus flocculiformis TaxID=82803 RepID=UPI000E82534F|nr:bifunctional methylenetetrahydrofolate dehydrogenase/methenyltetrahydrofolate cyclohydrolase FolD [Trichococcus flocculiformis]MBP6165018.1 bifunctional methylenetetrahydrofolate dehydrogenase/methenyltetrahydrofolate cyclohydrolase FolD [Trichococcus sp.]NCB65392.1 bifunctional methylenetetrahydrofolate dehydrogenase/methenyltetrahydrofolate cyclohydrolase FolD [Bacilli bacterium]MBP6247023.1 bifunctional methylenetetrahydrofolate dehydrogenase/methenyltetrahydrofolate cyclohydrolase FolD [T
METIIMDGKGLAKKMQDQMKKQVAALTAEGKTPGLCVILVGEDKASQVYVRNKEKQSEAMGMNSRVVRLAADISEADLLAEVEKQNQDDSMHGILVQLPLPKHIDEQKVLRAIRYEKDVDGFHPMNVGNFFLGNESALPCTPYGIMKILDEYNIALEGKKALVIGRSNIVGKPMSIMLLNENATVTIAHSRTKNLKELAKEADILVAAIGRGHFVTADFIKEGAVVIDVGMNRSAEGKLIGDVDTAAAMGIASHITPVPGGVGPMTITMLLQQTIDKAK